MSGTADPFGAASSLPQFPVELAPPKLDPWRAGNGGVAGVMSVRADAPGPHVVLLALMHGNEIAGAIVLDRLLEGGIAPARGRITCVFANLDAFDRFDPAEPTASRFVDEDLNRVWDADTLDGPRVSAELIRARQLRRVIDDADIVLDLHSMLWDGAPLILSGETDRGLALARLIGTPSLVVADRGHANGRRLLDYARFRDPDGTATACLLEAGQHWSRDTVAVTERTVAALLDRHAIAAVGGAETGEAGRARCALVTDLVTATTAHFAFTQAFRGGDRIAVAGTVIAHDGPTPVRTPYDGCMLVMPNLRPSRGHTAVRLARYFDPPIPAPKM